MRGPPGQIVYRYRDPNSSDRRPASRGQREPVTSQVVVASESTENSLRGDGQNTELAPCHRGAISGLSSEWVGRLTLSAEVIESLTSAAAVQPASRATTMDADATALPPLTLLTVATR